VPRGTQVRGEGRSGAGREVVEEDTAPLGEEHVSQRCGWLWWGLGGELAGGEAALTSCCHAALGALLGQPHQPQGAAAGGSVEGRGGEGGHHRSEEGGGEVR
jgi:hypothetical protein